METLTFEEWWKLFIFAGEGNFTYEQMKSISKHAWHWAEEQAGKHGLKLTAEQFKDYEAGVLFRRSIVDMIKTRTRV